MCEPGPRQNPLEGFTAGAAPARGFYAGRRRLSIRGICNFPPPMLFTTGRRRRRVSKFERRGAADDSIRGSLQPGVARFLTFGRRGFSDRAPPPTRRDPKFVTTGRLDPRVFNSGSRRRRVAIRGFSNRSRRRYPKVHIRGAFKTAGPARRRRRPLVLAARRAAEPVPRRARGAAGRGRRGAGRLVGRVGALRRAARRREARRARLRSVAARLRERAGLAADRRARRVAGRRDGRRGAAGRRGRRRARGAAVDAAEPERHGDVAERRGGLGELDGPLAALARPLSAAGVAARAARGHGEDDRGARGGGLRRRRRGGGGGGLRGRRRRAAPLAEDGVANAASNSFAVLADGVGMRRSCADRRGAPAASPRPAASDDPAGGWTRPVASDDPAAASPRPGLGIIHEAPAASPQTRARTRTNASLAGTSGATRRSS